MTHVCCCALFPSHAASASEHEAAIPLIQELPNFPKKFWGPHHMFLPLDNVYILFQIGVIELRPYGGCGCLRAPKRLTTPIYSSCVCLQGRRHDLALLNVADNLNASVFARDMKQ